MSDKENEFKKMEEALRDSEENYRRLADNSPDMIYRMSLPEGRYEYVSPASTHIFGYPPHVWYDNPLLVRETLHPDYLSYFEKQWKNLLKGDIPPSYEYKIIHKDGSVRWVNQRNILVTNKDNCPVAIEGILIDITDSKNQKERLRLSELRYRKAQELGKVGNWEYNLKTAEFWGSDEAKKIYGFDPNKDSFSTETVESCIIERERVHQALVDLIENEKPYNLEFDIITKNTGRRKTVVSIGELEKDASGNAVKVSGVFQDITERKQAEMEKEKLQAQLIQAQKMESVGRLAGGVAHDFNNMLGVILGNTELALLKTDENNDLVSNLNEIQKAAQRSADITKQLLAFASKQTISPKQIDLNDTVDSMLNMLRRLIGEDIDLVWKPSAHLWSMKMDPSQIDQILANLCINARDAIAGVGKITIETGLHTFDEEYCNQHPGFIPGDFDLLAVSDNGCGMDKDTLDNLFEPFFTTKEVGKGTGLGLATVYGIVKQNNGFINVYSDPGQGSTFKIYLPRLVTDEDIDKNSPDKKTAAGGTETILLVEDEPSILSMTRLMLERKGFTVLAAASPGEALEKAKNHSSAIELLMTDVIMPEMNGRDLAEQITGLYPDIRLLFMSGHTADVIAHQGVLDDGVAFMQKPFSMANMTAKVREVLDKVSNEDQL